ncbi:MAG TPA: hypothetical protein VJY31_06315 [Buttiauxella sp.]|nr:hypothetical protein [Buttiauxella sp.]
MKHYPLTTNLLEQGKGAAGQLYETLNAKRNEPLFKSILNMDLRFIDPNALPSDNFKLNEVEHVRDNTYSLHYSIDYFIFNLCKDMNLEDSFPTSINFDVYNDYLAFDVIDNDRDTVDEF